MPSGSRAEPASGPGAALGSLPAVFVKVCGITNEEDALVAVAMGADAVGFVFAPSSRQIAPQRAGEIARRLPAEIVTVGVFRDETRQRVVDIAHQAHLRAVQLHGRESAADCHWVHQRVPLLIRAFAAGDPRLDDADEYGADAIHIDSATPGSGEVFDWSLAEGAPSNRRVILAGGLTSANVADAIRVVRPVGGRRVHRGRVPAGPQGRQQDPGLRGGRQGRRAAGAARAGRPPRAPVRLDGRRAPVIPPATRAPHE